jgi:Fe2+ or Zn2+ uptake regulation protein
MTGGDKMAETFESVCKKYQLSPSITRKLIYEYLEGVQHDYHPTVDDIYKTVKETIPTLSKTTVYNVLNLFIKHHVVNSINTEDNLKKYELNHDHHSHFICNECHRIFDIPRATASYDQSILNEYDIEQEEVILRGLCPTCQTQ